MELDVSVSGQGKPLVLLHGWGFDSQIWQPLLKELETDFCVYRIDLPGFGQSDLMNWEQFKSRILSKLPEQFILGGWSLGGLYAMRLATENPERVSHLLSIASSPCFVEADSWAGIKKEILAAFYTSLTKDPEATIAHFQSLQKYSPVYMPQQMPSAEALYQGLQILHHWDLRRALDVFKNPTCFIFGRLDAITPFAVSQGMQERYPDFRYAVFRKSAHLPFLSETALFLETLRNFAL